MSEEKKLIMDNNLDPYEHMPGDIFHVPENYSTYYNREIEEQAKVPIANFNEIISSLS